MYAAFTEGIAKAWVSKLVSSDDTATAIGMLSGFQSICAFFASSIAGVIWINFGGASALLLTAFAAFLVIIWVSKVQEKAVRLS